MIKRLIPVLLLVACGFSCGSPKKEAPKESLIGYVDPLVGTAHCRWFHFTPGAMPAGMAKPGPSTSGHYGNPTGWEAVGFDYRDGSIEGFPCLHEFQVGGIVLMPTTGELKTIPGDTARVDEGYRSRFDRKDETAQAGYYSVLLKDYGVKAEITATDRVAYQRFTFPEAKESHILFDIGNKQGESGEAVDAEVTISDDGKVVEGYVTTLPFYVNKYQEGSTVTMFFSAVLDSQPESFGAFNGQKQMAGESVATGKGAGVYLTYSTKEGQAITAKVGLSYTSVDNARLNREAETNGDKLSFDDAKEASRLEWEDALGRIRVESAKREDKVKFYTGLYHAILGRGIASDVNGAYPKNDGTVGMLPQEGGKPAFDFINTDGIWGGQWNLVQVWALAYPEMLSNFVNTHVQVFKDSGWLGDGIACSRFVSGVGTNQIGNVFAAAYNCGVRDYDIASAYAAALKNEVGGEDRPMGAGKVDLDRFLEYGYVPHIDEDDPERKQYKVDEQWKFSASHTLEYSFGCYAVAQMAKSLGKEDDYNRLMELSKGWDKIYNDKTNFIHPKDKDGNFISNYNPLDVWRGYQEGNGWQYTFYVPYDTEELISKMGAEEFTARLDSIFTLSQEKIFSGGTHIDAFAGLQTLYNQGNQPCLHIPWLFNESGRPSLTQKWVRAILDDFYGTDGIHGYGYGQDEDQGQLGAWYVIASIGLFDKSGLSDVAPSFAIGSPQFDRITVTLDKRYYSGDQFVIDRVSGEGENIYIQSVELNGAKPVGGRVMFSDVIKGGKLTLNMGSKPNDNL